MTGTVEVLPSSASAAPQKARKTNIMKDASLKVSSLKLAACGLMLKIPPRS
jgi:hypothetical protein